MSWLMPFGLRTSTNRALFLQKSNGRQIMKSSRTRFRTLSTSSSPVFKEFRVRDLLQAKEKDEKVTVKGWAKSVRIHKKMSFVEVNDGSSAKNIQVVVKTADMNKDITTGCSIHVEGVTASGREGNEVVATKIELVGGCDSEEYPLQKKHHTNEFLREILHLRPRSRNFGAVMRTRSTMSKTISDFFAEEDFIQVHAPVLTSNDCEGAGELFSVNSKTELFGEKSNAHLTVSGQLHAEIFACSLSRVYSFGPTFRAENSNTARHLCEFWMLEPEVAFHDMEDSMALAERCVKYVLENVWDRCQNDIEALAETSESSNFLSDFESARLRPFESIQYDEAVEILQSSNCDFQVPVKNGQPLQSEHERFLSENVFSRKPVFVTMFPCEVKPFYAKHGETKFGTRAKAFDLLLPGYGEVIGGSEREASYDILRSRLELLNQLESLTWYLDLRKYGSVPHSGWGMGFDRLLLFATGVRNIRDVVPVPRHPTASLQF